MSIQAVAWALEQDLPARPKLVLVSVANHANHTDGYCWLKAETIASEAACTPRSVYRFIGGLVRNGYLRKSPRRGDDGKQRANDYWILLDRAPAEWDWGAHLDDDAEPAAEDGETAGPEQQDVVEPTDTASHGETDASTPPDPVDMHAVSHGPCDSRVSHKDSAKPSESNSEKPAPGIGTAAALRSYRPPPPQPIGAVVEQPTQQIFVYVGTRAWDAWVAYKKRQTGIAWSLTRSAHIDGKYRTGWWFPSLFPPDDQRTDTRTHGPPGENAA